MTFIKIWFWFDWFDFTLSAYDFQEDCNWKIVASMALTRKFFFGPPRGHYDPQGDKKSNWQTIQTRHIGFLVSRPYTLFDAPPMLSTPPTPPDTLNCWQDILAKHTGLPDTHTHTHTHKHTHTHERPSSVLRLPSLIKEGNNYQHVQLFMFIF